MRRIFLIRHGQPDFPLGRRVCLGRTDTPLGALGRMQAALLGRELGRESLTLFSSPLLRCRQTAAALGKPVTVVPELAEQDMGPWDGLDFDEIRAAWPELYARRASQPLLVPPGAETLLQVRDRVLPALERCLAVSEGDLAVAVHATVIQAILMEVLGLPPEESRGLRPPCGACAVLGAEERLSLLAPSRRPRSPLTRALAETLLEAAAPGAGVEAHCRAVAEEALRIADALPAETDRELLFCAALLHDAARSEKDHARVGAAWLRELGYEQAAALVEQHHDWDGTAVDEAAILFLADKCVREAGRVSLDERFAESEKRCTTPQARAAHAARYAAARRLREAVNALAGRSIVE